MLAVCWYASGAAILGARLAISVDSKESLCFDDYRIHSVLYYTEIAKQASEKKRKGGKTTKEPQKNAKRKVRAAGIRRTSHAVAGNCKRQQYNLAERR